jgi:hypothetical protein
MSKQTFVPENLTNDNKRIKIGIKDDIEPFVLITAFIQ